VRAHLAAAVQLDDPIVSGAPYPGRPRPEAHVDALLAKGAGDELAHRRILAREEPLACLHDGHGGPSRAKSCPSSIATGPPPSTTRLAGIWLVVVASRLVQ
jgi:hypothetical protein